MDLDGQQILGRFCGPGWAKLLPPEPTEPNMSEIVIVRFFFEVKDIRYTGWWFQIFSIFTDIWGRFPF